MKQDWFEYGVIISLIAGGIFGQLALATCQSPKAPNTSVPIVLLVVIGVIVTIRRILASAMARRRRPTSDPQQAGNGIKT